MAALFNRSTASRRAYRALIIQKARDPDPVRAMFPYSSVACRSGDHYRVHRVLGPEGCHDNGNSCLCECHDKEGI